MTSYCFDCLMLKILMELVLMSSLIYSKDYLTNKYSTVESISLLKMGWLEACPLFTFPACFDVSSLTTERLQPFSLMLLDTATKMSYEHCLNINSWRLMESIK